MMARTVRVQATCAKTGEGLMEGMEWIAQRVKGEAAQAHALSAGQPCQTRCCLDRQHERSTPSQCP